MAAVPADEDDGGRPGPREQVVAAIGLLDRPLTSYYLVLGCTVMLLALGLTMVLSASSVAQIQATGSAFTLFQKQALWMAIGLPGMWLASRLPVRTFRALAYPMLLLAIVILALVLVPGLGRSAGGATRWVDLGPVQVQPSELAKLALVLWGADLLARKDRLGQLTEWRPLLVPLMPGAGLLVLLVMMGSDLGTTLVLLTIFLGLLWVVGAPGRLFVGMAGLVCLLVSILIVVEPYRMQRLTGFRTRPATSSPRTTRARRACTRWRPAACSARGSGRAAPNGTTCPRPRPTSSSPSSGRSSGSSAPSSSCRCSGCSPTRGCGSRGG